MKREAAAPAEPGDADTVGDPRLPGVARVDPTLQARLDAALQAQGPGYQPRTHHLRSDGTPKFTNRLIEESSPYLLQHAHNPVNWFAWGDEAFERAEQQNKPVFLSVGYSTCHWCHVMERESFEDEEIAAYLNAHFVAIKVDREERPDVDSVYMTAVTILSGRGGWPMTVLMTPSREPFFGGTYFPPRAGARGARAGLIDILKQMVALYRDDPTEVVARSQEISQRVERSTYLRPGSGVPSDRTLVAAAAELAQRFDPVDGGFGVAPKFPQPSRLMLLLRYARRTGDPGATAMLTRTLDRMAQGGIYDHVGGGFHRYATDARWQVPHFEKMLYDNAQLAVTYLEAWQHVGDPSYRRIVREILDYVAKEMTSEGGGFYSATDADSPTPEGHDEEGWFFTWTPQELDAVLGEETAALLASAYGVTDAGNFEGRTILHRARTDREVATTFGRSPERVAEALRDALGDLYVARASRPPPLLDDKVITAWNGMMISAFARAGWALAEPAYVDRAATAADFVLRDMRRSDGELTRTYRDGKRGVAAFLDDYAFMVGAAIDLYEATGELRWLDAALDLQAAQDSRFLDRDDGGYFRTAVHGEAPLVREKPAYDGAVPSANSVSASNLLRLHDLTGDRAWRESAERLFASMSQRVRSAPSGLPMLLCALDRYYDLPLEIAVVTPDALSAAAPLTDRLRTAFVPNKAFAILSAAAAAEQQAKVPWLEAKRPLRNQPTAYVCERGRCELPTSKPAVFAKQIAKRKPYPSFTTTPPTPLQVVRARR